MKSDDRNDEQLIEAFTRGERAALAELARRYEGLLLGLACGMLGKDQEQAACDAVQETWVRVIRFAGSFNGRSLFKTWLYRIAINQCRCIWNAQKNAGKSRQPPDSESACPLPERSAVHAEYADRVRSTVAALPQETRAVVLLCYHGGMTHTEAADILEIPVGTLKSRLHAALAELRARLHDGEKP